MRPRAHLHGLHVLHIGLQHVECGGEEPGRLVQCTSRGVRAEVRFQPGLKGRAGGGQGEASGLKWDSSWA